MLIEPEVSEASIVLIGNLNPRIFTPDWFGRNDILSIREVETAEISIIHSQIANFRTDRLVLQVEPNKFSVTTSNVPFVWLKDMVLRTFKEFLPHTPLQKMGINRIIHFAVDNLATRDRIGHRLAPPEAWGEWAPAIRAGDDAHHGGMVSLVMQQRNVDDRPGGYIQASVQPSARIPNGRGVYIQVNDHYEVANPEKAVGCQELIDLLETSFDRSLARSEWIADQVMRLRDA